MTEQLPPPIGYPIEVVAEVEYLPLAGRHRRFEENDRQWQVTTADRNGVRVTFQQAPTPLLAVMGQFVDVAWAVFGDERAVEHAVDHLGLVWLGESGQLGDDLRVSFGLVVLDEEG